LKIGLGSALNGPVYIIYMQLEKLISNTIDLHVHVGPEIIPRKFSVQELIREEGGKLAGAAIKNHFFATTSMARDSGDFILIDSVVLNYYVGGFNSDIIRAAAELSKYPIVVWFPTINAKNFLSVTGCEIPIEWTKQERKIKSDICDRGLEIFADGKIRADVVGVLLAIKETNSILATGHISWRESERLVQTAADLGIKRIIITHPIYRPIGMPINIQQKLIKMGAVIEHCVSMNTIDKISIREIVEQIKLVGASNCILTSDVGQSSSPYPSITLDKFCHELLCEGISLKDLEMMLVNNPRRLVGVDWSGK